MWQSMLLIISTDISTTPKALYLLMLPKRENMFCFTFIWANVKNNNAYLKTFVLKKC